MKIKAILASLLAVAVLAGCSKDNGGDTFVPTDKDVAYMTLSVSTPMEKEETRSSTEKNGEKFEGEISTLYAITFDNSKKVVHHKDENPVLSLVALGADLSKPKAVRVTGAAKHLLIVANPGAELKKVLDGVSKGDTWASINSAIVLSFNNGDTSDGLADEVRTIAGVKGSGNENYSYFAMINSGGIGEDGLVTIDPTSMYFVGEAAGQYPTEAEAETAANNASQQNPKQKIKIERLSAKIMVGRGGNVKVTPTNASFTFDGWTLDVLNAAYFPYAEKRSITANHVNGSFYTKAFYTVDPNFDADPANNDYLKYNKLNPVTREPIVTWMNTNAYDYCIENTMDATEQRFKNATRVVIKATYYPDNTWTGDWFSFAGNTYKDLAALQAAYGDAAAAQTLKDACDDFYAKISTELGINLPGGFADLTQAHLDQVQNGGELVKANGCIKWYQKGLNYYFYEIRHDNTETLGYMAFGKYGVVRNNYYSLTLTEVSGSGTPWYPNVDPKDPTEPEGPGGEDEIDEITGFISFEIDVAPWIYWTTDFII